MIFADLNFLLYKKIWADVSPQYASNSYVATSNDAAVMFRAIASLFQAPTPLNFPGRESDPFLSIHLDSQIEQLASRFPENLAPLFPQLAKTYLEALSQPSMLLAP